MMQGPLVQPTPVLPNFALVRPVVEPQENRPLTRVAVQPARESRDTEAQRERNDRSDRVTSETGPAQASTARRGHRGLNLDINV